MDFSAADVTDNYRGNLLCAGNYDLFPFTLKPTQEDSRLEAHRYYGTLIKLGSGTTALPNQGLPVLKRGRTHCVDQTDKLLKIVSEWILV